MKFGRFSKLSLGSIIMLAVSMLVLVMMSAVLIHLRQSVTLRHDMSAEALELSDELAVNVMDIPNEVIVGAEQGVLIQSAATPVPAGFTNTSQQALTPAVTPYTGSSIDVTIGGTICIQSAVRQSCYYSDSRKYDMDEVMQLIRSDITGDLTLVSFENLTNPSEKASNLNAPAPSMSMLTAGGFNTVALGFPQTLDMGTNGLNATLQIAAEQNLRVIGVYGTEQDAAIASRIIPINGIQVAVLHYTAADTLSTTTKKKRSTEGEWLLPTTDQAAADIALARQLGAEAVIVSIHWSKSGSSTSPTNKQKQLAQSLADAGADVIIGSGSRVIQPVEWLNATRESGETSQVLCCYDLGTLISDSRTDNGVAGMLIHFNVNKDSNGHISLREVCYTPTYVWRYQQDGGYHYRIINSSLPSPDGMAASLEDSKNRALQRVGKKINNPSIPLRTEP